MVERKLAPAGAHALIAEGRLLGLAALYRTGEEGPFTQDDLATAVRMVRQAEQAVDNARRFTLEQAAAQLLRRSLAPGAPQDTRTVHTAEGHLQDIGNAWCEVIPLSGARTALVIGDVAEPGVRGIALMGRLRAGLLALAEQDPEPGELLSRLATLTARLARDVHLGLRAPEPLSTCLYLVYDPVEHTCQAASAGHPAPLIGPGDGPMRTAPLDIGPPLGPDRHAYETSRFPLADQSEIALFTSGLTALAEDGPEDGRPHRSAALREALSHARGSLEERCDQALGRFLGRRPTGDALLLLARTRPLPPVDVATWELSDSPEQVASATVLRRTAHPLGPGRPRLHHRTPRQRTGHQRHPPRFGARPAAPDPRPGPGLRGPRRQQLRAAGLPRHRQRREGPGTVHDRGDGRPVGSALRPRRQDGLGRTGHR